MERGKKRKDGKEEAFKRLFGVKRETFEQMKAMLQKNMTDSMKRSAVHPSCHIEDKLTITLKYYREYRTMEPIAADYRVSKSTVCQTIQWVEDTLKTHLLTRGTTCSRSDGTSCPMNCPIVVRPSPRRDS
jgi:hypothetical protein